MDKEIAKLVRAGVSVHWLRPESKAPFPGWADAPVASPEDLKASHKPGYNVGFRPGEFSEIDGYFLHVIDLDIRRPEKADEAWEALLRLWPDAEAAPFVKSGSGGESRHLYFLCAEPFRKKVIACSTESDMVWDEEKGRDVKKRHWQIEMLGTGSNCVLPPSIHDKTGKPYTWGRRLDFSGLEIGEGPIVSHKRVQRWVGEDENGEQDHAPLGMTEDEAQAVLDDLPLDQYCDDRDGWLKVGMALHHEFSGSKEGFRLWKRYSQQSEKFDLDDQRRVWRSFDRKRDKVVRMATLVSAAKEARLMAALDDLPDEPEEDEVDEYDFDAELTKVTKQSKKAAADDEEPDEDSDDDWNKRTPARLKELNEKHAVAMVEGKTVILHFRQGKSMAFGSPDTLHQYYENDRVLAKNGTEPITKAWMRHPKRRSYPNGIVFAPCQDVPGAYNQWRGFTVKPNPKGSCKLFLWHLEHVVCAGDQDAYRYAIGWFAHIVQHPQDKPGVAMVLRGKKGAGKDTVAEYFGSLLGPHHVKISKGKELYGNFNAHLSSALLLHVEEAFWAGDKQAEGALKSLITSERIMIEKKGVDAFEIDSYLRIFMSSNEDWVVPASFDERRFFVLNVSEKKMQNTAYFQAIVDERDNGGRGALLHYLQNYDLSDFDVRKVPQTSGLADQKMASLKNADAWWFECLKDGVIEHCDLFDDVDGDEVGWHESQIRMFQKDLRNSYERWMRTKRFHGDVMSSTAFNRHIRSMVPSVKLVRPRKRNKDYQRCWVFPSLDECREQMEKLLKRKIDWDE